MATWAWNDEADSEGVGHYAETNTDYSNATKIQQAYDYQNFSEITPNPITCWPLHEDSGTTANDLAGTNDGTIQGPTVGVTGFLGTTGYSFDGTDDLVGFGTNPVDGAAEFTVTGWVEFDSTSADQAVIFADDGDNPYWSVGIDRLNNGNFGFRVNDGTDYQVSLNGFTDTAWVHYAGVYTGSGARFYVNATEHADSPGDIRGFSSDEPYTLQLSDDDASFNLGGNLADTRIYNTALSASQIQTLYDVVATQGDWLGTGKTL